MKNHTDEALAAEVLEFFGKGEAATPAEETGLTVEVFGRRDTAIRVAEAELRRAFAGTAARSGQAVLGPGLLADVATAASGLGLGDLAAALRGLPAASLYVVRDGGRVWLPGVQPFQQGRDQGNEEALARELAEFLGRDARARAHIINELTHND